MATRTKMVPEIVDLVAAGNHEEWGVVAGIIQDLDDTSTLDVVCGLTGTVLALTHKLEELGFITVQQMIDQLGEVSRQPRDNS